MAQKVNFIINNKIEIFWEDEYYKCSVQDIQEETLAISIPDKGRHIPSFKSWRSNRSYILL